jgi:hypothetical protein
MEYRQKAYNMTCAFGLPQNRKTIMPTTTNFAMTGSLAELTPRNDNRNPQDKGDNLFDSDNSKWIFKIYPP